MTDKVYFLTKNYRVQCEEFKALLERVRKTRAAQDDAAKLMKLHYVFYRNNADFKKKCGKPRQDHVAFFKQCRCKEKNVDKLVETSKTNKVPVARLNCWYDINKTQGGKERRAYLSHFDKSCYKPQTDISVGARVALRN